MNQLKDNVIVELARAERAVGEFFDKVMILQKGRLAQNMSSYTKPSLIRWEQAFEQLTEQFREQRKAYFSRLTSQKLLSGMLNKISDTLTSDTN